MDTNRMDAGVMKASAVQPATGDGLATSPIVSPALTAAAPGAMPASAGQSVINNINVSVGVPAAAMPSIQFNAAKTGPNILVRAIWFLAVGFWLSALFILAGYFLVGTILLMPMGLWFLNRVPQAQTLRARTREFTTEMRGNTLVFTEGRKQQHPWYLRLLYLPIGLVLGAFWLSAAWLLSLTIVGLPLSIMMIDRSPGVITLQKN